MSAGSSPLGRGFEQYSGEVYGWAYRLLGRHHDALDVVQDVFLRWAQQCAESAEGGPRQPRGWLRRVTLNRAIDLVRHRRTEGGVWDGPASLSLDRLEGRSHTEEAPHAEEAVDRAALREDLARALDRLTETQRSVLVAKVYDEMTFSQIAAELNLAVSTIKTHYLRAIRAVRDRLRRRWADEEEP